MSHITLSSTRVLADEVFSVALSPIPAESHVHLLDFHREEVIYNVTEPIRVRLICFHRDEKEQLWWSWADYKSEMIDTSTTPSIGGCYEGLDKMGLINTLHPYRGQRKAARLLPRDVRVDQIISYRAVRVPDSCLALQLQPTPSPFSSSRPSSSSSSSSTSSSSSSSPSSSLSSQTPLARAWQIELECSCWACTAAATVDGNHPDLLAPEVLLRRTYLGEGVQRVLIRSADGVRGRLYLPQGASLDPNASSRQFPAVVDLFGSVGGLVEHRSALLASRGIISLALAYFNYEDLPTHTYEFDLKYFENAICMLKQRRDVTGVSVIGVSMGSMFAHAMACTFPPGLLSSVVGISPGCAHYEPILYHGKQINKVCDFSLQHITEVTYLGEPAYCMQKCFRSLLKEDKLFRFEQITCPILLLSGKDDLDWEAVDMGEAMRRRVEQHASFILEKQKSSSIVSPSASGTSPSWTGTSSPSATGNASDWSGKRLCIPRPVCIMPSSSSLSSPPSAASLYHKSGEDDIGISSSTSIGIKCTGGDFVPLIQHLMYRGTGHLIEPPYAPHCGASWHGMMGSVITWGGEATAHAAAQVHAWEATLDFIRKTSSQNADVALGAKL